MATSSLRQASVLLGLLALGACADPDESGVDVASTDDALSTTVGFHRFSGGSGAEVTAWGNALVVTEIDSVETYAQDPATTPGIANGTVGYESSTYGSAFVAATAGRSFTPLRGIAGANVHINDAASRGNALFALTGYGDGQLLRYDGATGAPVALAALTAYHVFADDQFVYTTEPGTSQGNYRIVRRAYDGSGKLDIGTYASQRSFLALAPTWAAAGGMAFTIDENGALRGYGPAGPSVVAGPQDEQATLASSGNEVFAATSKGLFAAAAGAATASKIRDSAAMAADAALGSVTCGRREEYGRSAAFTVDAKALYVICEKLDRSSATLLEYTHAGALRRRTALPDAWMPLGRLRVTGKSACAMQQQRYSSSNKHDILRCFKR